MKQKTPFFDRHKIFACTLLLLFGFVFILLQPGKVAPTTGDWQEQLAVASTAEFHGNMVTVKNIRNFRYSSDESTNFPNYYDKTFNIHELKKVWYISEPFNDQRYAAHTFLSFEFEGNQFLSITIEARKRKDQIYKIWLGALKGYPLIYVAADERDTVLLRANGRHDEVFVYPVKTTQENAKKLLVDYLTRMNELQVRPHWYNSFWDNCTSNIVYHVNRVSPGRISWSWKLIFTAHADELALNLGLLDTDLSIEQARAKYKINTKSEEAGDTESYSQAIRAQP